MHTEIIDFWFSETTPAQRFTKDPAFDEIIRRRFMNQYLRARRCELFNWRATAQGRLAEIIILDQFPRNMFRDSAEAFATDPLALALAQEGVARGADQELAPEMKSFFYLPYMHSESLVIHEEARQLYSQEGLEENLKWEIKHQRIIEEFGRYPHRNQALGRVSTAAEETFLQHPGSRF
jgi:uncharacterized protein (DUF924 family)